MSVTLTASLHSTRSKNTSGWDSFLFILEGDDRNHLLSRAANFVKFLEQEPGTNPVDLAASLAANRQPAGVALSIIASSISDLLAKTRKACDRLSDPNSKQIRDAAGTYFTSQPLFPEGKLALLFPGEGAQYPNMLADLCEVFPEVEETFAWCDQVAAELGRPEESLRNILHFPPEATPEDRISAETRLRRLGPSIFGVLIADLAIARLLRKLNLPVSAVAGHSAGELAALLAAGAVRDDVILGPKLAEIMDLMQKQEDEAGGPDVCLLAIGAGKAVVMEIAEALAGGSVLIAMDNCPHQCVAVGPAHLVGKVESELLERGLVCERLPFRRPYHTALFEPWMGPYREFFADIPFELPHTPVYCCSTGKQFPENADMIRQLAVNHWVSPVEFTKMVDEMYADGIRLFIEAGPRGNLSAFTEDILRGQPFAAIPANTTRKSGPTQINHLIGQLVAHRVPVNVNHLFERMETEFVDWERKSQKSSPFVSDADTNGAVAHSNGHQPHGAHSVLVNDYLQVMEQFLDVQREVMEAFLSGSANTNALFHLEEFNFADFGAIQSQAPPVTDQQPRFALIGKIEQFDPGNAILVRRTLDEQEDLYADHHTLAGRGVSRVNPGQNGLPVLPMTFSLEAMAEAASLLAPGKVVIAVRNVRLFRWIPFDPDPTTFEIRASITSHDQATGLVEVAANVRDLGNSFIKDGANKVAAEATIVLADRYPESPQPRAFQLTDEQPCRTTVEDLRRNMFHGPLFQMIRQLRRIGNEGIEGTLEVQPRTGWFRSNSNPQIVLDPVLIDAGMHILGAWHLEQPDWTGRILLPFEVQNIEFFGPTPSVGEELTVRGRNEQESARHFRHGMELFRADGQPWLRMTGAGYWRFYLPFGHVNFFGPKDEYFLSRNWPEAVLPSSGGTPRRCQYLDPPVDLKQPVLRAAGARVTLTPREQLEFRKWEGTDQGLNDWFFSRLVAKDAIRAVWIEKYGEAIFPADIETEVVEGRIVCRPRGPTGAEPFPPVSVVIAKDRIAAFSGFASDVGIALLPTSKDESIAATQSRAACQAVADALRIPVDVLRSEPVDNAPGEQIVTLVCEAQQSYPALIDKAIRVQTHSQKDYVVATTLCEVANR